MTIAQDIAQTLFGKWDEIFPQNAPFEPGKSGAISAGQMRPDVECQVLVQNTGSNGKDYWLALDYPTFQITCRMPKYQDCCNLHAGIIAWLEGRGPFDAPSGNKIVVVKLDTDPFDVGDNQASQYEQTTNWSAIVQPAQNGQRKAIA